jgi:hypothetical protein
MASADKAAEGSSLVFHPMDQFIVQPIFGEGAIQWYTITNMTLWMALAVICVIGLMVVGTSRRAVIPNRSQSIAELAYVFVYKMIEDVTGKDGLVYFPYIMTLFLFDPDVLYTDSAFRCDNRSSVRRVLHSNNSGLHQERLWFLGALLGLQRATCATSGPRDHRTYLLFRPPC